MWDFLTRSDPSSGSLAACGIPEQQLSVASLLMASAPEITLWYQSCTLGANLRRDSSDSALPKKLSLFASPSPPPPATATGHYMSTGFSFLPVEALYALANWEIPNQNDSFPASHCRKHWPRRKLQYACTHSHHIPMLYPICCQPAALLGWAGLDITRSNSP